MTEPSAKFAVFSPYRGSVRVEIYRPNGRLTTVINFDDEAAREFTQMMLRVVSPGTELK